MNYPIKTEGNEQATAALKTNDNVVDDFSELSS